MILNVDTQRIEYKGQRILTEMFQILNLIQNVYYHVYRQRWQHAQYEGKKRAICDYMAGMSDAYAL